MKVIIVMFDTLSRRYLPPYGNDWVIAPNFDRLAEYCVQFDNAYVGSMPCMPARREMHTGRYNFLHRGWGPLEPFDDSMPEILREAGIYTHKVTDHQHYWEDGGATYHSRFSTFEFVRGQEGDPWNAVVEGDPSTRKEKHRPNRAFTMKNQDKLNREKIFCLEDFPQHKTFSLGLEFLERNKDADHWLLQIECFDPHEPYFTTDEFRALYPHVYDGPEVDWPEYRKVIEDPATIEHLRYLYAGLVTMCDRQLGRILDKMDELRLWDDTMLIVNTDHGFLMGEHDWWAKTINPFYQEIAHIPLWIYDPRYSQSSQSVNGVGTRQKRKSLVQTIDIPATILDFFNVPIPRDMHGRPLTSVINRDQPIRVAGLFGVHGKQVNVVDGRYVYMRGPQDANKHQLFEYTLMPTRMRRRFYPRELWKWTKVSGGMFSFSKGSPLMKIPSRHQLMIPSKQQPNTDESAEETFLFDLQTDPYQKHPLHDCALESKMIGYLIQLMIKNEAPLEQYTRLGLPCPSEADFNSIQSALHTVDSIPNLISEHPVEWKQMPKNFDITIKGPWFYDNYGRIILFRGINVSGSSKVPISPNGSSFNKNLREFFSHRHVSFIGRPFSLVDAPLHFARLKAWGFTLLRFIVTWEAIEHEGPGIYDRAYLQYIHDVISIASKYGLYIFIDPHQDVWSRWCGGDGAPGWTLDLVGLDIKKFAETGSAVMQQSYPLAHNKMRYFPRMIWASNYGKLACATMFTLFFAGNHFAPSVKIKGQPVQDFLQSHYIAAIQEVAKVLRDLPNIIGFDTLNEPSAGFIGLKSLQSNDNIMSRKGPCPTPLQAMALGFGLPQKVQFNQDIYDDEDYTHAIRITNKTGENTFKRGKKEK